MKTPNWIVRAAQALSGKKSYAVGIASLVLAGAVAIGKLTPEQARQAGPQVSSGIDAAWQQIERIAAASNATVVVMPVQAATTDGDSLAAILGAIGAATVTLRAGIAKSSASGARRRQA